MSHVEVQHKSWFARLMESIKGVVFGLLLFVLAFPLLYWNEGQAARNSMTIGEGRSQVVSIDPDRVDPESDGKLVHLVGLATTTQALGDHDFDVKAQGALKFRRSVEMYQWKEYQKKEKRKKLGGGEETVITYTYEKVWSRELIDSSRFKESDYQNPRSMRYSSLEKTADEAHLGVFVLDRQLLAQATGWERIPLEEEDIGTGPDRHLVDGRLYLGRDSGEPEIGDLRLGFEAVMPTEVTVVAAQSANTFTSYITKKGGAIYKLMTGEHSSTEVFDALERQNTYLTWGLRACGFLMMVLGLSLIFRPLVVVADVVPLVGDLLGMGVGLFALLIATPLTLVTIAVGWMSQRPLIGCAILALAVGSIFLALKMKRRAARKTASR